MVTLAGHSVLALKPDQLMLVADAAPKAPQYMIRCIEAAEPDLRVSVYEPVDPTHLYCIGYDGAYGIEGRDYDAAVVLDKDTDPVRQVGEIHGHVGERMDRVLYSAAMYWNEAFIVGERQVGLPVLRRLHDEFYYRNIYYERSDDKRSRAHTDRLGHPAKGLKTDVLVRNLRLAVVERKIVLRSSVLVQQMGRVEFREKPRAIKDAERRRDDELVVALQGGGSPDLVMALVYAWHGINEVERFEARKVYKPPKTFHTVPDYDRELKDGPDDDNVELTW